MLANSDTIFLETTRTRIVPVCAAVDESTVNKAIQLYRQREHFTVYGTMDPVTADAIDQFARMTPDKQAEFVRGIRLVSVRYFAFPFIIRYRINTVVLRKALGCFAVTDLRNTYFQAIGWYKTDGTGNSGVISFFFIDSNKFC